MNLQQSITDRIKFNKKEIERHTQIYNQHNSKRQMIKLQRHYARLDELTNLAKSLGIKIEDTEYKRVKCVYCNKPINIDKLAGLSKRGFFCDDSFCLMELAKELEKEKGKLNFINKDEMKEKIELEENRLDEKGRCKTCGLASCNNNPCIIFKVLEKKEFKPCGKTYFVYAGNVSFPGHCTERDLCPECQEKYNSQKENVDTLHKEDGSLTSDTQDKEEIKKIENKLIQSQQKGNQIVPCTKLKDLSADTQDKENKIRIVRTLLDEIYRIVKSNPNIFNRLNYSVGTKDGCFGGSWDEK